ncbi:chaplin [Streptomyces nojiriensis]|uniref:chaplin family protein n=1 Tax=Streptomyces nojiriensis TaxID=66374 RepID=UPI002E18B01C
MKTGGSPGTPSGSPLRAPAGVPADARGLTADAAALPNPAFGATGISARPSTVMDETPASE